MKQNQNDNGYQIAASDGIQNVQLRRLTAMTYYQYQIDLNNNTSYLGKGRVAKAQQEKEENDRTTVGSTEKQPCK